MGLLGSLVGADEHRGEVRRCAVGQPHLGAVDAVPVAILDALRLDRRDVRPEVRLGHRERAAHLALGHRRQVALLLLGCAVLNDHVRHDEVGVDHAGHAHPAARELLDDQGVGQQRLAEPAVLLRNGDPEQAHLLHAVDDVLRVLVGVLEGVRVRNDFLVHERLDGGEDLPLDVGEPGGLGEAGHGSSWRGQTGYAPGAGSSQYLPAGRSSPVNVLTVHVLIPPAITVHMLIPAGDRRERRSTAGAATARRQSRRSCGVREPARGGLRQERHAVTGGAPAGRGDGRGAVRVLGGRGPRVVLRAG